MRAGFWGKPFFCYGLMLRLFPISRKNMKLHLDSNCIIFMYDLDISGNDTGTMLFLPILWTPNHPPTHPHTPIAPSVSAWSLHGVFSDEWNPWMRSSLTNAEEHTTELVMSVLNNASPGSRSITCKHETIVQRWLERVFLLWTWHVWPLSRMLFILIAILCFNLGKTVKLECISKSTLST